MLLSYKSSFKVYIKEKKVLLFKKMFRVFIAA